MRYILDFKYNGDSLMPITMALLRDDNTMLYVGFKEIMQIDADPWVQANVIPVLNDAPVPLKWLTMAEVRTALLRLFKDDKDVVIVTDWPVDVMLFNQLITVEPSVMLGTPAELPRLTFCIERVDAYPTMVLNAIRHNAAWDAMALRHKIDYPNETPVKKEAAA